MFPRPCHFENWILPGPCHFTVTRDTSVQPVEAQSYHGGSVAKAASVSPQTGDDGGRDGGRIALAHRLDDRVRQLAQPGELAPHEGVGARADPGDGLVERELVVEDGPELRTPIAWLRVRERGPAARARRTSSRAPPATIASTRASMRRRSVSRCGSSATRRCA